MNYDVMVFDKQLTDDRMIVATTIGSEDDNIFSVIAQFIEELKHPEQFYTTAEEQEPSRDVVKYLLNTDCEFKVLVESTDNDNQKYISVIIDLDK